MVDVITYNSNKCIICQQDDKEGTSSCNLVRVSEKGLDTTLDYFISNEDQIKVWKCICRPVTFPNVKVFVHGVCRQDFTNPLRLNRDIDFCIIT